MHTYKFTSDSLIIDCDTEESAGFDMYDDIENNPTIYIKYPIMKFIRLRDLINAKEKFPEYFL